MKIARIFFIVIILMGLACRPTVEPIPASAETPGVDNESLLDERAITEVSPSLTHTALPEGTIYIRVDGGSPEQCTGLVDAAYPGDGLGQSCAWDHPFRALPPGREPVLEPGGTLVIGPGDYRMGVGDESATECDADAAWDCHMPPIPGGLDPEHPTRILGSGWDRGCDNAPQLWGTERANWVLNLGGSSNVEVACLEITDHSECVEYHSGGLACERDNAPYGDWAAIGLFAIDSANVVLRDLNIHGLANTGVLAGRLTDWTVSNLRIAGNGWAGWDGDVDGDDGNQGTLLFDGWIVEWNGCAESYPGEEPIGCWAQEAGGYGDGVGTGETGGDWIIRDSYFLHNTSDGLDLLYHSLGGTVVLDRVRAEGNAGNQIKVTGQLTVHNSIAVANCAFFEGRPFTYWVDHCRALGNALEVVFTGGEQVVILNSSFYGQGDGLVGGGPREGYTCNGDETLTVRNSLFYGDQDYFDAEDVTFYFYQENCGDLRLDSDYNIVHQAKNIDCGVSGEYVISGEHDLCSDPELTGPLSGLAFGMQLSPSSLAIDAGDNAQCMPVDFLGRPRPLDGNLDGDAVCDMGAYEWIQAEYLFVPLLFKIY